MRAARAAVIAAALAAGVAAADADRLEFTLHKNESSSDGRTVLVIGGIQGDEPGGFNAASLLVTHYHFRDGGVWVVPNLNFESIVKRSRGVHGDMNRKFSHVSPDDPDYHRVEKIKRIILDERVDFIFNLHDGSGFYRPQRIDRMKGPERWGQSIIIDQEFIEAPRYGGLGVVGRQIADAVNEDVLDAEHAFRVKNTRTREGDVEMEKTLTYFAINHGKPAVGIEASKALPTHLRAYYHLRVLEAYLQWLGIRYERSFDLDADAVRAAIDGNVTVSFYDNRLFLDMANARKRLGYVPLKKDAAIEYTASSPLVAITGSGKSYRVNYGNRRVTTLHTQPFDYDHGTKSIDILLDGAKKTVPFGTVVEVDEEFNVESADGLRVNVIGWKRDGVRNESGIAIRREDIAKRFSVDEPGMTFRIEVYRGKKFAGMVLVRFIERAARSIDVERDDVS